MKTAMCVAIAVAVVAGAALAQVSTSVGPAKHSETTGEPTYEGRIEGDTIEECWTIPSLPFLATGNTCGFADDYEEMCPYSSTSADVVYSYSPLYDMCVSISLCDSYYDTKLFVYEDGHTPGVPLDCNDDNFHCVDPPVDYTSWLEEVALLAGHTYYIVVDGYCGDCGDYVLAVDEIDCSGPCDIVCVGIPEGEPTCYDGYDDQYNGGCSSLTWSYIGVTPEPSVHCGESGIFMYDGSVYRDTDWYLIHPCGGVPITVTVESEIPVFLAYIDLRGGCANMDIYSYVFASECEETSLTEYLPLGQFAVFVAPDEWALEYECGSEYSLTIEGYTEHCDPTPVESMSWGRVKALYR
jgi:hypothetical protein